MNTSTITKVTREWLKIMGYISLWILAIALPIYIFQLLQGSPFLVIGSNWYSPIFNYITASFYFLIMGIVLPLRYTKRYLNLGVTRKQLICGMIIAVLIVAVVVALFFSLTYPDKAWLTTEPLRLEYIPQHFILNVVSFILYYLFGLLVAIGFSCRNFFTAAAGLIITYGGLTFAANLTTFDDAWGKVWSSSYWTIGSGFSWEPDPQFYLVMPFPLYIATIGLLITAAVVIVYILSKKVVIKAS